MDVVHKLHTLVIACALGGSLCIAAIASPDREPINTSQAPVYKPPKRGAPATRVGGGTRGGDNGMILSVLAPEHTGWTNQAQPVLYWYIAKPTNIDHEIIVYDGDSVEPLLALKKSGMVTAGVHALNLADHHVQLQQNVEYEWSVSLINAPQQPSKNIVAAGTIIYVKASSDFQTLLNNASPLDTASLFASHGYWYDAMHTLLRLTDKHPDRLLFRKYCSNLLKQVGLSGVANKCKVTLGYKSGRGANMLSE